MFAFLHCITCSNQSRCEVQSPQFASLQRILYTKNVFSRDNSIENRKNRWLASTASNVTHSVIVMTYNLGLVFFLFSPAQFDNYQGGMEFIFRLPDLDKSNLALLDLLHSTCRNLMHWKACFKKKSGFICICIIFVGHSVLCYIRLVVIDPQASLFFKKLSRR